MTDDRNQQQGVARWLMLGALLGGVAVGWALLFYEPAFEEVEDNFPEAEAKIVAAWKVELDRRTKPGWLDVPDPPGEGPVTRARYWLSHWSYDMEVRRRGDRFVVVVAGVAPHIYGGGWASYGEGRITGRRGSFAGAEATFSWSCLGVRFRHSSDGVGRIVFDETGKGAAALYMAYEAPYLWAKAYAELQEPGQKAPPFGAVRGEIPIAPVLSRLPPDAQYRVRVRVTDGTGSPLQGALVQVKGRDTTRVVTDDEGRGEVAFRGKDAPVSQVISAGCAGHRNSEAVFFTDDTWPGLVRGQAAREVVTIELRPLDLEDHPQYEWARSSAAHEPDDLRACGTCHPWHYDEWYDSRHARMADNGHVTWERKRMLAGDSEAPDDCCGCHQPALAMDQPDVRWAPRGSMTGNHCDFCHKIRAAKDLKASGVLGAYEIVRPSPAVKDPPGGLGHVFGSLPDATFGYMGAGYNPLFEASHLCAGCHQGGGRWKDGSPPKLDTYEEWSDWVAQQAPEDVKTCQDCHMQGGLTVSEDGRRMNQVAWNCMHRTPEHLHSHRFFGTEAKFAAEALQVRVDKRRDFDAGEWIVTVEVTNTGAGHKIPTGTWGKRVIVGVWATDRGKPLRQVSGDRTWLVPDAATDVAYAPGDWRNPGGLVLSVRAASDPEGRHSTPAFWMRWPKEQILDRRLAPGEARRAVCRFRSGASGTAPSVEVRVLYRRERLPAGLSSVPWTIGWGDPAPEVLWLRMVR